MKEKYMAETAKEMLSQSKALDYVADGCEGGLAEVLHGIAFRLEVSGRVLEQEVEEDISRESTEKRQKKSKQRLKKIEELLAEWSKLDAEDRPTFNTMHDRFIYEIDGLDPCA